jgi:hypothetical protein
MTILPPRHLGPGRLAADIRHRVESVLSREDLLKKRAFIDELSLFSVDAPPIVLDSIIYALFSLTRDVNAVIRLRSLSVLATQAFAPSSLIDAALSKGEHNHAPLASQPHVGAFGLLLEDAVPEVRAMAVRALAGSIRSRGDARAVQAIAAIAQVINDSSPLVRAASITGLCRVSGMVDDLVTLEDQQLRLVLPVLSAVDSAESDRREVILFLKRLKTQTRDQTMRVMEELAKNAQTFPRDLSHLAATACAFGRNNAAFIRLCAVLICRTLSPIGNFAALTGWPDGFVQILTIASACLRTPFPVTQVAARDVRLVLPIVAKWENAEKQRSGGRLNTFTDVDELRRRLESDPLAAQEIVADDESLTDACDLVLDVAPAELFKIEPGTDGTVSVNRYKGVLSSPKVNTPYTASSYVPGENFFFEMMGKVTPVPGSETPVLVAIEAAMLQERFLFEAPHDQKGEFSIKKSIVFPECNPYFIAKLTLALGMPDSTISFISDPIDYWFIPRAPTRIDQSLTGRRV